MKLTGQQIGKMMLVAGPLMDWLQANCHPHCHIIINGNRVEIVETLAVRFKPSDELTKNFLSLPTTVAEKIADSAPR